jgi:hypothetical protein
VRPTVLLIIVPVSLIVLAISFWFLPTESLTPFNRWVLIEIVLGFAFVVSYSISSKERAGREVPFIIAGLIVTMLIVLSYVTVDVQRIAFVMTAVATSLMYFRVIVEFRRRKYT